jgi:hypothetical protein
VSGPIIALPSEIDKRSGGEAGLVFGTTLVLCQKRNVSCQSDSCCSCQRYCGRLDKPSARTASVVYFGSGLSWSR